MSIERLSLEARILYSGFCAFVAIGVATSVWLYLDDGLSVLPGSAARYYLGDPASMVFEKPPRQVMETFHFHVFVVPIVLLVVGHIYLMCELRLRTKAWTLGLATVATLLHLLAPVLVRFAGAGASVLVFPSALLMAGLWLVLTIYPIFAMWFGRPPADTAG
ncbi:MAG: hypothetical protein ACAI38_01635 [Myxococcota bacterium]|nr:hypothetical protein [Myxococcota bacterium]